MSLNRELLIDRIKELSQTAGISSTKALQESGAGKDFVSNLKKGQSPSIEKIALIADYFGVTVDYLLGKEEKEKSPSISDEDLKFALFNGDKDIPDDVLDEVKRFAQYAKERYGNK